MKERTNTFPTYNCLMMSCPAYNVIHCFLSCENGLCSCPGMLKTKVPTVTRDSNVTDI